MHSAAVAVAGVIPFDPERRAHVASPIEPGESAALFVGIRDFLYDETLTEVKYGVNDAIDLAYVLAIERTPHLIEPKRIRDGRDFTGVCRRACVVVDPEKSRSRCETGHADAE